MRKTFLKLPLTLLACPLLAVMAISGQALGTKEAKIRAERENGRL